MWEQDLLPGRRENKVPPPSAADQCTEHSELPLDGFACEGLIKIFSSSFMFACCSCVMAKPVWLQIPLSCLINILLSDPTRESGKLLVLFRPFVALSGLSFSISALDCSKPRGLGIA